MYKISSKINKTTLQRRRKDGTPSDLRRG